ncbi:glycosyltransferase [Entomobacter blattae]|uniref:Undecaprenyl-phosphate 4-deoxy-4-formamido-L-arabinose transferase n=1 Tax=Entomobacter blattae TaxID=2762277 RepID=A0A7H1NQF4_9PROT|nr:glycosyltransferase [Entomobacter blattae]QNT78014.1 Undecaprenyl-phosphate 4-deoxy-4-formamido-L-arabinose transferase [Entomobacter blattae]
MIEFVEHYPELIVKIQDEQAGKKHYAVILDGQVIEKIAHDHRKKKQATFSVNLSQYPLAQSVNIYCFESHTLLAAQDYPLLKFFGFSLTALTIKNLHISGQFSLHHSQRHQEIWLECLDERDNTPLAFGMAQWENKTQTYHFSLPLQKLIDTFEPVTALFRLLGIKLHSPRLQLTDENTGMAGFVDHIEVGKINGWAYNPQEIKKRVSLDLVYNGQVLQTTKANIYRPDLFENKLGDGHCGFTFELDPTLDYSKQRMISVVVSKTTTHLRNSPVAFSPPSMLRGFFDRVRLGTAEGWAIDYNDPEKPAMVEIVWKETVLAEGEAKFYRGDLLAAGLGDGFCAFKVDLSADKTELLLGESVFARIKGTNHILPGSPQVITQNENILAYQKPNRGIPAASIERFRRMAAHRYGHNLISLIMPVYNTPVSWLKEALDSVLAQWVDCWELLCIDDASTDPAIKPLLTSYAEKDSRIKPIFLQKNSGIAVATNKGIQHAQGTYIAFMDHDDWLEPDAIYHLSKAIQEEHPDLIYTDEVATSENLRTFEEIKARPAFSYDYYLSHPYFVHLLCVPKALAEKIGGWDEAMPISADVDFVLRILEVAKTVTHIPRVVYRWRTHEKSTGHSRQRTVMEATKKALQNHLNRVYPGQATVEDGASFNQYKINWKDDKGRILIVIPTKNRGELVKTAVESIEKTANRQDYKIVIINHDSDDPATLDYFKSIEKRHIIMPYSGVFNYSHMNNLAVKHHGEGCKFVLFLNNDIEAIEKGWLNRMRALAARPDVGVVGALLLYPDDKIQHAGVIMSFNGSADHAFKFIPAYIGKKANNKRNIGYNSNLTSVRDFSAVTAACLMMRIEVFNQLGGFDEKFSVGFNDTDLCLRAKAAGYKVLYDGMSVLYHYESATRSHTKQVLHPEDSILLLSRYDKIITEGDPYYNPNLSLVTQDHVIRDDKGGKFARNRTVTVDFSGHTPTPPLVNKASSSSANPPTSLQAKLQTQPPSSPISPKIKAAPSGKAKKSPTQTPQKPPLKERENTAKAPKKPAIKAPTAKKAALSSASKTKKHK